MNQDEAVRLAIYYEYVRDDRAPTIEAMAGVLDLDADAVRESLSRLHEARHS